MGLRVEEGVRVNGVWVEGRKGRAEGVKYKMAVNLKMSVNLKILSSTKAG